MIRLLVAFACAVALGLVGLQAQAQSVPTTGPTIPTDAQHIGHQVLRLTHPCTGNPHQSCTAIVTFDAYKVDEPLPAPPGAVVSSAVSVLKQIQAEHAGKRLTAAMTRGASLQGLFHTNVRHVRSGCTGCGGPWYFGCPSNIYEHLQWDEQDYLGVPIYHVAQDNQDTVNCQSAWTVWRNPSCQTLVPFWACQPPAQDAYWDGYNHVDWVNTPLKYNPFPYDCEQDLVYTRTYTSVAGRVTAYASRTMSNC